MNPTPEQIRALADHIDGRVEDSTLRADVLDGVTDWLRQLADESTPPMIGKLPRTADGVAFGLHADLWLRVDAASIVACAVLAIEDPDSRHHNDYPTGQRWIVRVRDEEGRKHVLAEGRLWSSLVACVKGGGS